MVSAKGSHLVLLLKSSVTIAAVCFDKFCNVYGDLLSTVVLCIVRHFDFCRLHTYSIYVTLMFGLESIKENTEVVNAIMHTTKC